MYDFEGQEASGISTYSSCKNDGDTAFKQHKKAKKRRVDLDAPSIQPEYAKYFNAVDINDYNSADYSISIRTTR